jgi:acyl-CoA thioesterase I
MRICFFGDSFVNGTGDDEALGWPGRLLAAARRSGLDVSYYNLGIRRDTSDDIAARWRDEARRRLPEGCNPRLAFSFGTNDCATNEAGVARVPLKRSLENAENILRAATAMAPTLMIGPLPAISDETAAERVHELSREFATLCQRLAMPYLATADFVARCDAWTREARAGDGAHPNNNGYAALAEYIAAWPAYEQWLR